DVGHLMMQDAETGEQLLVDTHDRGFRRRFAEASAARETQIRAAFGRAGTEAMGLSTEDDLVAAIVRMAELRRRRRRAAWASSGPRHSSRCCSSRSGSSRGGSSIVAGDGALRPPVAWA